MARIELDFDAPRGIHYTDDDGRIGVVTTLVDRKGHITGSVKNAYTAVVYMGDDCPLGSWREVEIDPDDIWENMPAGSA